MVVGTTTNCKLNFSFLSLPRLLLQTTKTLKIPKQFPKMEVRLHVYDVTNSASPKTNNTILNINRFFKDGIGLGGIFHSAVQIYGDHEWSFGYCENGTGVFNCPKSKNPIYTYRECIILGETQLPNSTVNKILRELSKEWPGNSYDLLSRNCNHFCEVLCEKIEVPNIPAWVNRFAHAGDTANEVAGVTAQKFRQAKTEIATAGRVAYRFLLRVASTPSTPKSPNVSDGGTPRTPRTPSTPRFQGSWFRSIASIGAKPSTSNRPDCEKEQETQSPAFKQQQQ